MDHNERDRDISGKPKPIPIRETVGDSGRRPTGKSDVTGGVPKLKAPGLRGQRERPSGPRSKRPPREAEERGRRAPAGKSAASGDEEPQRPELKPTLVMDFPNRIFEHDGCEWIVRLCGQTSTGSAMDPAAPLLHLVFYTAADPTVACGEALVAARSLEGIAECRLPEFLTRARTKGFSNESAG